MSGRTVLLLLLLAGCKEASLGAADAYVVLRNIGNEMPPKTHRVSVKSPVGQTIARHFIAGFGAEVMGTAHLAARLSQRPGPVVLILDAPAEAGRGLILSGTFTDATFADVPWTRITAPEAAPGSLDEKEDLVALVRALGGHIVRTIGSEPSPFGEGYVMALEAIAREIRSAPGARGVLFGASASAQSRQRQARIRENGYVLTNDGKGVRAPQEFVNHPGFIATFLYRLAQSKELAGRPARDEFYRPLVDGPWPAGITPAAILGSFRNGQAKLMAVWRNRPVDVIDFVVAYGRIFPDEERAITRLFIATTFGATVVAGGVSVTDVDAAQAAIERLTDETIAGKQSLRAALDPR